jgi:ABC-2 type transport system ATP-binding protein
MADTLVGHLSKGYRQRVGIADALVANPPLLILDEPTAGLDPNQIRDVRKLIRELGETHTILLSTHILSEVESTCDRAIVIDRGRLVAEGTLDELQGRQRAVGASLLVRGDGGRARAILSKIEGVKRAKLERGATGELVRVNLAFERNVKDGGALLEASIGALVAEGLGVREASPARATLEDVFARLTHAESEESASESEEDDS